MAETLQIMEFHNYTAVLGSFHEIDENIFKTKYRNENKSNSKHTFISVLKSRKHSFDRKS